MMSAEEKSAWLNARCGFLTASNMANAMKFKGNGESHMDRVKLMYDILAERASGENQRHVVTDAMQWGTDHEDEAVDRFVELTGRDVKLSRFYIHPEIEYFGATPDRELDDGLIEVKCPTTPKFMRWRLAGVVPEEHRPQILAQLACTGRKWCGFIAYDPRVKDERKQLFLAKYVPEPEEIGRIEAHAIRFLKEVEEMWEAFTTA